MENYDKKLIVIIPAFNEEKNIRQVIKSIPEKIEGVDEVKCIVIDDGSQDKTSEVARSAGAAVIRHKQNRGLGEALLSGINCALDEASDIMVNIDADGQFDAGDIGILIKPIINGEADFVAGNRFVNGKPKNMPLIKYWGNIIMSKLISYLAREKFSDVSCGFRAYNQEALLNLNIVGKFTYTQESFLDMKYKNIAIKEAPISVKYFNDRKSKMADNLFKYTTKTLGIILRTIINYQPLKFFCYPGLLLNFFGILFIGFLILYKLNTGVYSPYKAYGFIGGGLMIFGTLMIIIGLFADIIDKIRINQEKILYHEKRRNFKKKG